MPCAESLDDYEVSLLRELVSVFDESNLYNPKIYLLLDEILMNCKFTNINKVDSILIQQIVAFIPSVYQNMITKSYEDSKRCDFIKEEKDLKIKREV
jgi:hypothetical protein